MRKFKSFQDKGWLAISYPNNSSVIRQKDKFQNGHNKKAKAPKYSEKANISYSLRRTCWFQGVRNVRFSGNFCFLDTCILRFVLLPYYPNNLCLNSNHDSETISSYPHIWSAITFLCRCQSYKVHHQEGYYYKQINDIEIEA